MKEIKKLVEAKIKEYGGAEFYKKVLSKIIEDLSTDGTAFSNRHQIEYFTKVMMYVGKNY